MSIDVIALIRRKIQISRRFKKGAPENSGAPKQIVRKEIISLRNTRQFPAHNLSKILLSGPEARFVP